MIYTTNEIESLNRVIRKATKQRNIFPTDDSAMKVVYLAMQAASKSGRCSGIRGHARIGQILTVDWVLVMMIEKGAPTGGGGYARPIHSGVVGSCGEKNSGYEGGRHPLRSISASICRLCWPVY